MKAKEAKKIKLQRHKRQREGRNQKWEVKFLFKGGEGERLEFSQTNLCGKFGERG